ncbi:MAG TPA: hypothetical protein VGR37_17395 [Longimicrobiaceae bacterium]|nr:hypothetical protein [Longimicrobiaceae bacterium]
MQSGLGWAVLALAFLAGAFGGGWLLAWLYKRLHPELAFYKLWALWSMLLAGAATLLLGWGVL